MFDLAHIDVAEPKFKAQSYAIYARLVPQVRAISPRHHIPKERVAVERRFWTVSRLLGSYPETGLEEIAIDFLEADFPIPISAITQIAFQ